VKNFVILSIDTMRFDALGVNSDRTPSLTPFLDSIQKHCVLFKQAYSGGPYTQAAFPGLLSSSHYLEYGKQKGKCPKERVLISEVLQKNGFSTGAFHSNAYLSGFFGWNRGWNKFYDSMADQVTEHVPYVRARDINQKAKQWLASQAAGEKKPVFLWVHYMDLHEPYMPEPSFQKLVDPELQMSNDEMFVVFKETILKRDVSDPARVELAKKLYDAQTVAADRFAKELFTIIDQTLGLKDTTIFIVSDHGEEFNEHGGLSHDGKMFDELVRVPFCIYNRGFESQVVSDVVSTLDLPPTIAQLAGVAPDPSWQGQSLLPLEDYNKERGALGEAIDKRGPRELGNEAEVHYYRQGDYKIIYSERTSSWELYNLADDPEEKHSIYGEDSVSEYMMKKIIPRINRYAK
jgi:arylsulfatase A-like enzyme